MSNLPLHSRLKGSAPLLMLAASFSGDGLGRERGVDALLILFSVTFQFSFPYTVSSWTWYIHNISI